MPAQALKSHAPIRVAEFPLQRVQRISELVYRDRLGPGEAEKMIAKDGDNGEQLAERSLSYDSLTRSYLRAIEGTNA